MIDINLGDLWIYFGDDALDDLESGRIGRKVKRRHEPEHFIRRLAFFGFCQPQMFHQGSDDFRFVAAVENERGRFG